MAICKKGFMLEADSKSEVGNLRQNLRQETHRAQPTFAGENHFCKLQLADNSSNIIHILISSKRVEFHQKTSRMIRKLGEEIGVSGKWPGPFGASLSHFAMSDCNFYHFCH